jgi:tetratricopeptide (TPR) repeat protein
MLDPYQPIKYAFNQIKQKIPTLNTIEQKLFYILRIIIILSAIILIYVCIHIILEPEDGYDVQSFETMGIGENTNEKALATLLKFYLQNIKDIYDAGPNRITIPKNGTESQILARPLENISVPPSLLENLQMDYSLSQIGTLGVEGVSISIGNALLLIKKSLGDQPNTITCSLQRYNSTIILVAIIKDNQHNKTMTFENESIRFTEEQIPSLINDLAFKISLALCKQSKKADLYPNNWQTFKYVTQGRDAYNSYILTRDSDDLNKSYNLTLSAEKFEPGYMGTFELRSHIGFCYIQAGNLYRAENIFQNISQLKLPERALAIKSAWGLGNIYSIYNTSDYNKKALNAYDKATKLNPENPLLWNNKGVVLCRLGNYSEGINAFKKAIDLDNNYMDAKNNLNVTQSKINFRFAPNNSESLKNQMNVGRMK